VISVVVPTLNEEAFLPACLAALAGQAAHEVIVVDGGSTDGTAALAQAAGARLLTTGRGRAEQLAAGAAAAHGDVLLFLHADTLLPSDALARIEDELARRPEVVAGSFRLQFDNPGPLLRLLAACGNAYHRLVPTLYGDRAAFVRRRTYTAAGGFRTLPIMEDVDLSDRARRLGRIIELETPVVTSARAFRRRGPLRLTARILAAVAAHRLGLPVSLAARIFYGAGGSTTGSGAITQSRASGGGP
jgi:rSAM/selenodomain-associated transferase 2